MDAADGKVKKILCYRFDQRVGNTDKILLLSLRTIRDANIDILHHMDQSLDGISSPLLFLKDKVKGRNKKKGLHGRARSRELSKEAEGKVQLTANFASEAEMSRLSSSRSNAPSANVKGFHLSDPCAKMACSKSVICDVRSPDSPHLMSVNTS